jgi:hypothetical protein
MLDIPGNAVIMNLMSMLNRTLLSPIAFVTPPSGSLGGHHSVFIITPPEYQRHLDAVYSMPPSEFEDGS